MFVVTVYHKHKSGCKWVLGNIFVCSVVVFSVGLGGLMQTFLPYADFEESVKVLDYRRLGKQRVETYQILKALLQEGGLRGGWAKHPASRMWEGYELALLRYQEVTCHEWTDVRNFKDTCWEKSWELFSKEQQADYLAGNYDYPDWLGDDDFHAAHRSNLVRKASHIYRFPFGNIADDLPYIWPGRTLEEASKLAS